MLVYLRRCAHTAFSSKPSCKDAEGSERQPEAAASEQVILFISNPTGHKQSEGELRDNVRNYTQKKHIHGRQTLATTSRLQASSGTSQRQRQTPTPALTLTLGQTARITRMSSRPSRPGYARSGSHS